MTDLSHLSDVTGFQTVINHLERDPEITGIINVLDQDLAKVAGIMYDGDTAAFAELMTSGKINSRPTNPKNAVDVIYLPPFYVFKDRGVIFQ